MNSEYLAETWWWVALWAKYRDNGWSQAGDRGTNTGSDPWVARPQKTDSQASISASSSGTAAVVKFVLLYQVSLRPLKICRLQLESLKGFQA